MIKGLLKIALLSLVIAAAYFVFAAIPARAEVLYAQPDYSGGNTNYPSWGGFLQLGHTTSTFATTTFSDIYIAFRGNPHITGTTCAWNNFPVEWYGQYTTSYNAGRLGYAYGANPPGSSYFNIEYYPTSTYQGLIHVKGNEQTSAADITIGPNYYFDLYGPSDCGGSGRSMDIEHNGAGDLAVIIATTREEATDYNPIPPTTISFAFPTNGTSTTEFANWAVDVSTATTTPYYVEIGYILNGNTSGPVDVGAQGSGSASYLIPKSEQLIYLPLADGVQWDAEATLRSQVDNSIMATSSISFNVYYNSVGNASSSIPQAQCSPSDGSYLGDFRAGLCQGISFLFYPSRGVLDNWSGLKNDLADKPPFGYFTAIKTGLDGLATSTPTSTLMTASTISSFSPILTPIRAGFALIIWLLAGFWLYHRMREITI